MDTHDEESGHRRELEEFRRRKAEICFEEQLDLVLRLRELAAVGGFEYKEAAARARPGGRYTLVDDNGEVKTRRVSDLLSPRDDRTFPTWELTEAMVVLYAERTGAAVDPLLGELRAMHQAVVNQSEVRREQVFLAAVRDGRREATAADVAKMGAVIADLRTEVSDLDSRLAGQRELEHTNAGQRYLLAEQATTMEQLRRERDQARTDADQLSARLALSEHDNAWLRRRLARARDELAATIAQRDQLNLQLQQTETATSGLRAENDQLTAEIRELHFPPEEERRVRQDPAADSTPAPARSLGPAAASPPQAEDDEEDEFYETVVLTTPGRLPRAVSTRVQRRLFVSDPGAGSFMVLVLISAALVFAGSMAGVLTGVTLDLPLLTAVCCVTLVCVLPAVVLAARPERLIVVKYHLRLGKTFGTRTHSWKKIARVETTHHDGMLNLTLYAADGTTLDEQNDALTFKDWEKFTRSVNRVAPHVAVATPPRQPTAA